MADLCCQYTIAGMTLNPSSGDGLFIGDNGIEGLDGRPIRSQIDPKGRTDGGLVHEKYFGPRPVTFTGIVGIRSTPLKPNAALWAAVYAVEQAWIAALEAILNTPSPLAWTPSGSGAHSLTVTYGTTGGHMRFSGPMIGKQFAFTLVAEDG